MLTPHFLAAAAIHYRPGSGPDRRRIVRAALAGHASAHGFAVTELFETSSPHPLELSGVKLLVRVAKEMDARAVLTVGEVGDRVLEAVAAEPSLEIVQVPYPSTARPKPNAEGGAKPVWTGRLGFDLKTARQVSTAIMLEADVRLDTVTLACAEQSLAVMDRVKFAAWLGRMCCGEWPVDGVVWAKKCSEYSAEISEVTLRVQGREAYVVSSATLAQLAAVL